LDLEEIVKMKNCNGFLKLPFIPPYMPFVLFLFWWLFWILFYIFYSPFYFFVFLFSPHKSEKSKIKFFEKKSSNVDRNLTSKESTKNE